MEIRTEEHGRHIVVVTIDNPNRMNAMSREMLGDLARLWDRLEDSACRVVVITGAGNRAFCAGADMGGDLRATEELAVNINRGLLKNSTFTRPIVAAVNGDCVAGGLELLLSTDIRIAAETARFGLPEVKWSIYPFGGATVKLIHQIGYIHAMDLLLTARLIDAETAARINLVNEVLPGPEVLPRALAIAETIAANSPVAVQAVRRQISETVADQALSREALDQILGDQVRASPEFREGVAAFLEKRKPNYK